MNLSIRLAKLYCALGFFHPCGSAWHIGDGFSVLAEECRLSPLKPKPDVAERQYAVSWCFAMGRVSWLIRQRI